MSTTDYPPKIGKYDISGIAGKGAMGVVYVGHDPFVDRKVAIKVSTQDGGDDGSEMSAKARKMFFNEARAAGALDHPNILRVYEAGDADGQPYIVMEYVEHADTLRSYCKPETLLPIKTVVEYVKQCALALDYAHKHGITHRDIKPANLMLTDSGVVKIVDFGIAQRTKADQTQIMGWFGSPLYMSPEQAADEGITYLSDLFSLGVVTYELLTGTTPFAAKGISGLINNVLNKDPEPLTALRPEIPESLWLVVKRCLAKRPAERYQSGAEIAAALDEVLDDLYNPLLGLSDEQKLAMAKSLAFFTDFSDAEVREMIKASTWLNYRAGTRIIEEGAQEQSFFIILSGDVSVTRAGKEIAILSEGACFGEMAYLTDGKRSASVSASGAVAVMKIATPLRQWASLPLQMRLNRVFQRILIERLAATSRSLAMRL
jgi:serine/threonine protein kinase